MKFKIKSGKINITDPCYDVPTNHLAALNGTWVADVVLFEGANVRSTRVYHEDFCNSLGTDQMNLIGEVGVDSGQVGYFDSEVYNKNLSKPIEMKNELPQLESAGWPVKTTKDWYRMCCNKTIAEPGYGIVEGGFVSKTAYGDGAYPLYGCVFDGLLVAAEVLFDDEDDDAWGQDEDGWDEER